jgi:hypothetical protein
MTNAEFIELRRAMFAPRLADQIEQAARTTRY